MEDVVFERSHSQDSLPEAGNDPGDPLRPEIDEENSVPNAPLANPFQDMEATDGNLDEEAQEGEADVPKDDQDGDKSDNESELSELDENQFGDFDEENIDIEARPGAAIIDETNVNLIGVHKRKRAEGEEAPKKKKKKETRREKPRRGKKAREDAELEEGGRPGRAKRARKEGRTKGATPDSDDNEENLTPEERRKRALDRAIDASIKTSRGSRRRKGDIDLEQMADQEIEDMRKRMAVAAELDNEGRKEGKPAFHKLKLLPEVVSLLNRNTLKDSIVDPEINLLEAVRFFLEPLSDGSLPAYDIQKELFAALRRLPINKESLIASGIGKVILFYTKSKVPEPGIRRQAEQLYMNWTRPILRRTDDYRKKEFQQAEFDRSKLAKPSVKPIDSNAAARQKALEIPRNWQRARMEPGPTSFTIVPKSNVVVPDPSTRRAPGAGGDDIFKRLKARQSGRGGGR